MKQLITIAVFSACIAVSFAQSKDQSSKFIKEVGAASGGPAGIDTNASTAEHEAQLAAVQALLPNAPDQAGIDAANSSICVLLALLGRSDEASQVADKIQDMPTREKRKLQITHIAMGKDAAVAKLKELLANPQIPPTDHVIYVEKLVSLLSSDEKKDNEIVELATSALENAQFKDSNARVGFLLVKFQQKAVSQGLGDKSRIRTVLDSIVAKTLPTEKTQPLLGVAKETSAMIPAQ